MTGDLDPNHRLRIARKAAAFDALMRNLPTAGDPLRGDDDVVKRARAILAEPAPEQDAP